MSHGQNSLYRAYSSPYTRYNPLIRNFGPAHMSATVEYDDGISTARLPMSIRDMALLSLQYREYLM